MNVVAETRNARRAALALPTWAPAMAFLVVTRLVLNAVALIAVRFIPLGRGDSINQATVPLQLGSTGVSPYTLPGVWAQWDAGYYLSIAARGYSLHGNELAFFPAYPFLIQLLSPIFPRPSAAWSAYAISIVAFIVAGMLLWRYVEREHGQSIAWGTIVILSIFPTSLFFSAIYTESLFLLLSVLVYVFSVQKKYEAAAVVVSLASLTRIGGVLLALIPLVEIVTEEKARRVSRILLTAGGSGIGLGAYMAYLWISQGSPIAFLQAMNYWKRSVVFPWQGIIDAGRVVISGYGGFEHNWFMRMSSLEDLLATLLFVGCTAVSYRYVRASLFAYSVGTLVLLLVTHGPYTLGLWSMSRYVLGLFPEFIVLAILLGANPRLRRCVWAGSVLMVIVLTGWFATGRWVA